jgi:hypothetical protein
MTSRHIVIPVDFSAADDRAFNFFLNSLHRPGDIVDIIHVLKASEPVTEIYHGAEHTRLSGSTESTDTLPQCSACTLMQALSRSDDIVALAVIQSGGL